MKNLSGRCRLTGIGGTVVSMIVILGLLISAMLISSGCGAEQTLASLTKDNIEISHTEDTAKVTAPEVSFSDTGLSDDGEIEVEIPKDHEDVIFANYLSDYYIVVYTLNNSVLVLGKDENGRYTQTVKTFLCSTGSFDNNTVSNNGVYDIVEKHDWRFMMGVYGHYCTRIGWGTGYLFHSVPYRIERDLRSQTGAGFDNLGTSASHGCIRLCSRDAKWIYDNIPYETQVRILDDKNGPPGEPIPMRKDGAVYAGWDPTDPDANNPYSKLDPSELTYFTHTSAGTQATTAATAAPEQ